jgi:Xaa-Pro aminopeptidase
MFPSIQIPKAEYHKRNEKLQEYLQDKKLTGAVLFDHDYILYYCGFAFYPTERPIAYMINARGEKGLFVPRLEVEHAQAYAIFSIVSIIT